jgi:hypothetical protein
LGDQKPVVENTRAAKAQSAQAIAAVGPATLLLNIEPPRLAKRAFDTTEMGTNRFLIAL